MTQGIEVLREQTRQFINENPTDVAFIRGMKVPDGAGGNTFTTVTLNPQTVRIVEQDPTAGVERQSVSGKVVRPIINVLCDYDADIRRGDQFKWQDLNVQIVWVTDTGYAKTAEVATL